MTAPHAPAPVHPYKAVVPAPLYWCYRAIRTLLTASCFGGFWSGAVLLGWIGLPVLLLWPGTREQKLRRVLRAVERGFRLFHLCMRVMRLYHRTSPVARLRLAGVPPEQPVVIVANHPTLCDTTSIISTFPDVVAVARPTLANHLLLRRLVRACGFVPVGIRMMKECEERLRMGFDVLIFPEGTRSPADGLHPFHRGAFELAARAKVPVVLVKLTCVPPALSKRLPIWKVADHMAVLTMEPFDVIHPASGERTSRAWAREIEQRYRERLGYSSAAAEAVSEPQPVGDMQ